MPTLKIYEQKAVKTIVCAFYLVMEYPRYYLKKEIEWITNWGEFLPRIGGIPGTILHIFFCILLFHNNQSHAFSAMVECSFSGAHRRRVTQTRRGKKNLSSGYYLFAVKPQLFQAWKYIELQFWMQFSWTTMALPKRGNIGLGRLITVGYSTFQHFKISFLA